MTARHSTGLLGIALIVVLGGCAGSSGNPNSGSPSPGAYGNNDTPAGKALKVGVVFDSGGRGDKSFNDSAWRGIEKSKKTFNIRETSIDSKQEKDYEGNLSALADQGMDLVFAVGTTQGKALEAVAPKYPNVKFAIIDGEIKGDNVRSIRFKEEEGSFLAGYLAGLTTKTNKIGFVGGMDIPIIAKFRDGYTAGAVTANPKIEVLPAKFVGNWMDQNLAKVSANVLFSQGADIVYHAAGRAGLGVISAAKAQGKYAIGVDSDQDGVEKGTVLASMVKSVDEAVFQTVKDLQAGKFVAGTVVYDVKSGLIGLSPMTYTKDKIGKDAMAKVSAMKDKIAKGQLLAPANPDALRKYLAARK